MRETIQKRCEKHGVDYSITWDPHNFGGQTEGSCYLCDREAEREVMVKESNVSPEHIDSTCENFVVKNKAMQEAKDATLRMINSRQGKLFFVGSHGTGKTHLASAAVLALWGQIWTMYEISCLIRESYTARAKESEMDIVKRLASLPMLAIDEIGRTKGSDAELNWLSYIIDKRHTRGLPIVLVSNKHRASTCQNRNGCPDCIEQFLPTDSISRMGQDGKTIDFMWEDFRRTKR